MSTLSLAAAVASKDLRVEVRGRYGLTVILPFAGTLLIAFGLSLGPGRTRLQELAPALLWLSVLFASILAFRRSYESEAADAALEGMVLAPVDRAAIFLGKAGAVAVQLLALEAAVLALSAGLFGLSLGAGWVVLGSLVLGTLGLAAVGSMFGVTAAIPRVREAILPLLVLPLAIPVLVAGVEAMDAGGGGASWLGLLAAFDAVFIAAGVLVFDHLLED